MTIRDRAWTPDAGTLDASTGPRYVAVADALAEDLRTGRVEPGQRLPTHRDLATRLGLAVGTITRAYALAEELGLIRGEVGRGTFALGGSRSERHIEEPVPARGGQVDLSLYLPLPHLDPDLGSALRTLGAERDLGRLLEYQPHAGSLTHRTVGADLARRFGLEVAVAQVAVCCGIQHAIMGVMSASTTAGDVVLTEKLTYPGLKVVADVLGLRLVGIDLDEEGMLPDALEAAAVRYRAKVLYCAPTLHNPTAAVMGKGRRAAIVGVAERHDVSIVEDASARLSVLDGSPPLAAMAPERTHYILDTAKVLGGGLGVGYVISPESASDAVARGICATTWTTPPLVAEIAARWARDGTLERVAGRKREEAAWRQLRARRILSATDLRGHRQGLLLWIDLPEPWNTHELVRAAKARGVLVRPAESFLVGRGPAPHAARVALGGVEDRGELERGLEVLADVLSSAPEPELTIV